MDQLKSTEYPASNKRTLLWFLTSRVAAGGAAVAGAGVPGRPHRGVRQLREVRRELAECDAAAVRGRQQRVRREAQLQVPAHRLYVAPEQNKYF